MKDMYMSFNSDFYPLDHILCSLAFINENLGELHSAKKKKKGNICPGSWPGCGSAADSLRSKWARIFSHVLKARSNRNGNLVAPFMLVQTATSHECTAL